MGIGVGKDKLIYNGTTPDDGDSVASYLYGSGGKLTSTTIGGIEALDVNVAGGSLTVDLDGVYAVTTNETPDNVGVIAHTRAATPSAVEQVFRSTGGTANADGLTAANIHGLDVNAFAMVYNGTSWDRLGGSSNGVYVQGSVADDTVDAGNPLKIGMRALSGALSAVSATGDRADVISDLYRRMRVVDSPNISLDQGSTSIPDTTATAICTAIAGRIRVLIQNLGNKAVFVGSSDVTASGATGGIKVSGGSNMEIPLGENVALYGISESGNLDVRWLQLA
jgi:hypothetical protein